MRPLNHDADAIGDVDRDAEVLLDQQDRDLASPDRSRSVCATCSTMTGSQPFGRLVHDEQAWREQQRAADRQHSAARHRELGAAVSLALGEARNMA
jgi:hypothetical protein